MLLNGIINNIDISPKCLNKPAPPVPCKLVPVWSYAGTGIRQNKESPYRATQFSTVLELMYYIRNVQPETDCANLSVAVEFPHHKNG